MFSNQLLSSMALWYTTPKSTFLYLSKWHQLWSRPHGIKKAKLLHQLSLKILNKFWWNFILYWDLLAQWRVYSFYLARAIFKDKTWVFCAFIVFCIALLLDIHVGISFKIGLMINIFIYYNDLTFAEGNIYKGKWKCLHPFFDDSLSVWMKLIAQLRHGMLKLIPVFFLWINIQGWKLCLCDFIEYTFKHWLVFEGMWTDSFKLD